jgi:hypothetical protein
MKYSPEEIKKAIELAPDSHEQKKAKDWSILDVLDEPSEDKTSEDEPKLQAPKISADKDQNAVDRVMAAIPKGSFEKEAVAKYLKTMSEEDIIDLAKKISGETSDHDHEESSNEECVATKKNVKSLKEYLKEQTDTIQYVQKEAITDAPGGMAKPKRIMTNEKAMKELLELMDGQAGDCSAIGGARCWKTRAFSFPPNTPPDVPEELKDEWAKKAVEGWNKRLKTYEGKQGLDEQDIINMAAFHLTQMQLNHTLADQDKPFDTFAASFKKFASQRAQLDTSVVDD